ncbi:MAG: HlyD family efflux transporter periplasmic adaptor subunit [Hyphomicrobiaceae bacterium]
MTAALLAADGQGAALPPLRRDLVVEVVAEIGRPFAAIVVTDPVRGSYFKLVWPECAVFLAWQLAASTSELQAELQRTFGLVLPAEGIESVVEFGLVNQLTKTDRQGGWHSYAAMQDKAKRGLVTTVMHGYLFFRIPLVRPEPWLRRLLPWLSFVYTRPFWLVIAVGFASGLYLAAHDWSSLAQAAGRLLEAHTLALYGAALVGLKLCHELGHALTTVRYGCRVPSMGVAIMLGMPIFYTDTSDSWRLARNADRLRIVLAGVAAESIVASLALLAWSFLDAGGLKDACFAIATTSIVTSLVINLNPCMRFDGYFALSDALGVANLQPRAFALGRWKLRERLFGLGYAPPEQLPVRMQWILVRYAVVTAIYRFFLFMGIAAIVYVVAGKTIGIVLAGFEIGYFIVKPIVGELMVWWSLRAEIQRRRRAFVTGTLAALGLLALFLPWQHTVEAPGVRAAAREAAVYLPFAARLAEINVKEGDDVRAGDVLFEAIDEELESQLRSAVLDWRLQRFRVERMVANGEESEMRGAIEGALERAEVRIAAVRKQMAQLQVRAPFDGRIVDLDPALSKGIWLDDQSPLAYVVEVESSVVRGMIRDLDMRRVEPGAEAVFIPDDAARAATPLKLSFIAPASDGHIGEPMLADEHGGGIAADELEGKLVTKEGMFEVTFASIAQPTPQVVRGIVRIEAAPTSPAASIWRRIARILVREQSF